MRSGFIVSIVGKPNSGKSTLINKLAKRNVAITSRISGTTRDIIELRYNLDGIPIVFLDTAGIRKSKNKIEKIGISKSLKKANSCLEDQHRCRKKASSRSIEKHKGFWPPRQNPLCFAGRRDAVTATCKTQGILIRRAEYIVFSTGS